MVRLAKKAFCGVENTQVSAPQTWAKLMPVGYGSVRLSQQPGFAF
jgi:hypothetical protein